MTLTAEQRTALEERLTDARRQYHLLATGQGVAIVVDQNGERIEFRPASISKLASYIRDLERQLGIDTRPSGPMQVLM